MDILKAVGVVASVGRAIADDPRKRVPLTASEFDEFCEALSAIAIHEGLKDPIMGFPSELRYGRKVLVRGAGGLFRKKTGYTGILPMA